MKKKKAGKLDHYAEARIWNLKLRGKSIRTIQLMDELIKRYKLSDSELLRDELKIIIRQARRRVYQKRAVMKKNIQAWAVMLDLPAADIKDLVFKKILTKNNIKAVFLVLKRVKANKNNHLFF